MEFKCKKKTPTQKFKWFSFFRFIKCRITDIIAPGTYGRLAIGVIIFIHIIAYNETGAVAVLFSTLIATVCATFSG